MKRISFDKTRREEVVAQIQRYFVDELDHSIGAMPAELLLDFFTDHIGASYYNQGLADAQAVFTKSIDHINDSIYGLEQREARAR